MCVCTCYVVYYYTVFSIFPCRNALFLGPLVTGSSWRSSRETNIICTSSSLVAAMFSQKNLEPKVQCLRHSIGFTIWSLAYFSRKSDSTSPWGVLCINQHQQDMQNDKPFGKSSTVIRRFIRQARSSGTVEVSEQQGDETRIQLAPWHMYHKRLVTCKLHKWGGNQHIYATYFGTSMLLLGAKHP